MRLCILRHAIAADARPGQGDDARPLTAEGRRKFELAASGLRALELRFDLVLHSPLRRAVETAELLRELVDGRTQVTALLAQPPSPELLARIEGERVALVGHEPFVSMLTALLVAGDARRGLALGFKKGGAALLEGRPEPAGMALTAFLPPAALRAIGGER